MNKYNLILNYASEKFFYTNIPTIIWNHITSNSYNPSAIAIRVYMLHFNEWMKNKGISYISTPQIVREFDCARSSVTDAIKKLKEMELIEVVQLPKNLQVSKKWTSKTLVTPKFPLMLIEEMKSARTRKKEYDDPDLGKVSDFEDLLSKINKREEEAEEALRQTASKLRKIIRGYFINKTLIISEFYDHFQRCEDTNEAKALNVKEDSLKAEAPSPGFDEVHRILSGTAPEKVVGKLSESLAAQITWYVYGQLYHLSDFMDKEQKFRDESAALKILRNKGWKPPKRYPAHFTDRCFGKLDKKDYEDI